MRYASPLIALSLALALPGCGEDDQPPAETAEKSLAQFSEAVSEMEAGKDQLEREVKDLREGVRDQLDKHLALLQDRIEASEARLAGLPAEREVQLRQAHEGLRGQIAELRQLYEQWAGATGEQATQLRKQLDERRSQLEEAFSRFESELDKGRTPAP